MLHANTPPNSWGASTITVKNPPNARRFAWDSMPIDRITVEGRYLGSEAQSTAIKSLHLKDLSAIWCRGGYARQKRYALAWARGRA